MYDRVVGTSGHGSDPRKQMKPCGNHEEVSSEAVDILAAWITEDMEAVAKSFDLNSTRLLGIALERLKSGAVVNHPGDELDSKNGSNARSLR